MNLKSNFLIAVAALAFFSCPMPRASAVNSTPYTWQSVQIVGGGFVDGIVFSPAQDGLVYCRTDIGGVYRWDPPSSSWIPLLDWVGPKDWYYMGVESIAADPSDANRVYAAVGEYTTDWDGNGAILRSDNRGATWQISKLSFQNGSNEDGRGMGERLQVDPNDGAIVYFGTRNNGLWKSVDYGATWHKVLSFPLKKTSDWVDIGTVFEIFDPSTGTSGSPTQTIYAGAGNWSDCIYVSHNAGATWSVIRNQPTGLMPVRGALSSDGTLYVTYANNPGPNNTYQGAVYKLDTATGQWTDITPIPTGDFGYAGLSVDAEHPLTVMVSTIDRWSVYDDIFRSTDGGATWTPMEQTSQRDDSIAPWLSWGGSSASFGWWIEALAIDPFDSNHVLYGTGATIWSSDDVTNLDSGLDTDWTVGAAGIEETADFCMVSPPVGAHLVTGVGDIGGFVHNDLTVSPPNGMCQPAFTTTTGLDYAQADALDLVRVGTGSNAGGYYSLDGGATWLALLSQPLGSTAGGGWIAIAPDAGILAWSGAGAPSYSTDWGATWTASSGVPTGDQILADRVSPSIFYAYSSSDTTLYASTDGAKTFSAVNTALPAGINQLMAMPDAAGDLWLAANSGLFHSTDGGGTFTAVHAVQVGKAIGWGAHSPREKYPALYMIGTVAGVSGVYRSVNEGVNWVRINDSLHQYGGPNAVTGDPRLYGRVYLGTFGRGILYADPS